MSGLQAETAVAVSSSALLRLGDKPIASLTESTDRARLAAGLYDSVRRSVLRDHNWNCAIKRVSLAPEVGAPAFDWQFAFLLPGDWLKIVEVGRRGESVPYQVEGQRILANENPLFLRYVFDNDNEATWDAALIEAMTARMAAEMAYAVTQSATMADAMWQKYRLSLARAKTIDGQDEPPYQLGSSRLLQARFGPGGTWNR